MMNLGKVREAGGGRVLKGPATSDVIQVNLSKVSPLDALVSSKVQESSRVDKALHPPLTSPVQTRMSPSLLQFCTFRFCV